MLRQLCSLGRPVAFGVGSSGFNACHSLVFTSDFGETQSNRRVKLGFGHPFSLPDFFMKWLVFRQSLSLT
jgi:hypothetical protein